MTPVWQHYHQHSAPLRRAVLWVPSAVPMGVHHEGQHRQAEQAEEGVHLTSRSWPVAAASLHGLWAVARVLELTSRGPAVCDVKENHGEATWPAVYLLVE